jgi:hypothetical protein
MKIMEYIKLDQNGSLITDPDNRNKLIVAVIYAATIICVIAIVVIAFTSKNNGI